MKKRRKKRKLKKRFRRLIALVVLIFIIALLILGIIGVIKLIIPKDSKPDSPKKNEPVKVDTKKLMDECVNEKIKEDNRNEKIIAKENEILSLIKDNKYEVSIYYTDLTTDYEFKYNEDEVYYGASLIKLLDALYIIDKVNSGDMNLEANLNYKGAYKAVASECLDDYKKSSTVPLNKALECAITLSDNAAHHMIVDYIGETNLRNYGKSLGAKNLLGTGDKFGNQTANNMNIFLKKLYPEINKDTKVTNLVKKSMNNDFFNNLSLENNNILHKYGLYDIFYHDVGISMNDHPYIIVIMTKHANRNYKEVTNLLSTKIYELNTLYYDEINNYCAEKIKK